MFFNIYELSLFENVKCKKKDGKRSDNHVIHICCLMNEEYEFSYHFFCGENLISPTALPCDLSEAAIIAFSESERVVG